MLNDNNMSISENVGGISQYLSGFRTADAYRDFKNNVKMCIRDRGGKVTGSVSKKTDYLVNNDTESTSSKNKKAKDLGIPIISEDTFIAVSYTHLMT